MFGKKQKKTFMPGAPALWKSSEFVPSLAQSYFTRFGIRNPFAVVIN